MRNSRLIPVAIASAAIAVMMPAVSSADAASAKAKAAQHAGLAAGSGEIGMVQRHLHHTLNCLVGANGEGFDESAGNPCAQDGGAIPQTSDAAMKSKLEGIAEDIRGSIMGGDLAAAQEFAGSVQEMLAE